MFKRNKEFLLPTRVHAPGFRVELRGTVFRLVATGSWTVREAAGIELALERLSVPIPPSPEFTGEVDIADIKHLDTAGAWLLQRTVQVWQTQGLSTSFSGGRKEFGMLLEEVAKRDGIELPAIEQINPITGMLSDWSRAISGIGQDAILLIGFLGALTQTLMRSFVEPWRFRSVSFIHHLEQTGFRAVPIVSLICLLIGAVVMQQSVVQLERFGAETFAVNMLGVLSLREVGVLLTAIMVAGRSGSAFTAEIGSMKMREEIDAMRTLGIDPMETLVLPRVLALVVALPLLTFLGGMMCLTGGGVMAYLYLGLDPEVFVSQVREAVDVKHFYAGMIKSPFAAIIIGLVGCIEGLKVEGSAESLGRRVTSAVVKSIFLVIILDAVFAMFLSSIGF